MQQNIQIARTLRKNLTDAERKLWQILRYRQLNNFRFRRQVAIGPYIADFACFEPKIIIEIDGGQHNEYSVTKYDQKRTKYLKDRGYQVLRFWNNEVLCEINEVAEEILRHCLLISFNSSHQS